MTRSEIDSNIDEKKSSTDDFSDLNPKQRAMAERMISKRGNTIANKNTRKYMADPNVKVFNKELRTRVLSHGHKPYAFYSLEQVEKDTNDFLELCDRTNTIPTVVNLAVWLGVNKDTIYAHVNDSNSPYSDFFKNLLAYLHGTLESSSIEGTTNPVLYMFLGKNYFGMRDDKQIQVTAGENSKVDAQETATALQKQLAEENVPNADYKEENS